MCSVHRVNEIRRKAHPLPHLVHGHVLGSREGDRLQARLERVHAVHAQAHLAKIETVVDGVGNARKCTHDERRFRFAAAGGPRDAVGVFEADECWIIIYLK